MSDTGDEPKFNKNERNPLSELSELRMVIEADEGGFDITCQLRFSTGEVSFNGREYTVGITEARSQISLEGCETALGCDFGNAELQIVDEEQTVTSQAHYSGAIDAGVSLDGTLPLSASVQAKTEEMHHNVRKSNNRLGMFERVAKGATSSKPK